MWVSVAVKEWFQVSRQAYEDLKVDNAALRAELSTTRLQTQRDQLNFDWLRIRCNELERENKALIQKAYGITLPAPQLERQSVAPTAPEFSFDDIGDVMAKQIGLDIFSNKTDD